MKDEGCTTIDSLRLAGLLCAISAALAAGCGRDSAESFSSQTQTTVEMLDGTTSEVVVSDGRVVALRASDGQVVPFERGTAVVRDQIVVRSPDGSLTAFRQPAAINEELDKLPYVYLKQGTLEEFVTDGCLGEPYFRAEDQSFYWTARTCTDSDCGSQAMRTGNRPYLFIHQLPGIKLMADNRIDFIDVPPNVIDAPILCPICGKKEHVVEYAPAESAERKLALDEELERVRSVRDQAALND